MPSVNEEFREAEQAAYARGKAAGEADSRRELEELRARNARLEKDLSDLRKRAEQAP